MSREGALNVDAPVTLDELFDRNARETLGLAAGDLGLVLAVGDRDGLPVVGAPFAPEAAAAPLDYDPVVVATAAGRVVVTPLLHEGDVIGRVVVGPFSADQGDAEVLRLSSVLVRMADAFLHEGTKRALSARMHMATVEESARELTEKNRRLHQAVERLQEADRVKSNFLATVSHELRTPLTSVIGYSEMLLEGIAGELNPEQREYVRTVMEKGDQLLQLINGVLDISRMEAGQMKFERTPFDLDDVVSQALSTVAPEARKKKLQLTCELPPELPQAVGDKDKTRQVLLNLLNNATKFTPEGGRVAVAAELGELDPHKPDERRPGLRVAVRDTGIGIAREHHHRVFDPFYQVDNTSTREFGGTGLGLNIVKRFVEAQGGTVWVESEPSKGSTFVFTLPVSQG